MSSGEAAGSSPLPDPNTMNRAELRSEIELLRTRIHGLARQQRSPRGLSPEQHQEQALAGMRIRALEQAVRHLNAIQDRPSTALERRKRQGGVNAEASPTQVEDLQLAREVRQELGSIVERSEEEKARAQAAIRERADRQRKGRAQITKAELGRRPRIG